MLEENNAEGRPPGLTYEGRRYELIMEYWRTVDDPSESDSEFSEVGSSSAQSRAIASSAMGAEAERVSICDAISEIAPVGGPAVFDSAIVWRWGSKALSAVGKGRSQLGFMPK